jgi:Rho GDP-dissociation inhibitor
LGLNDTQNFVERNPILLILIPNLDSNDESLRKWKESLGISGGPTISDPNDPRKVIIQALALEVQGRPDAVLDLADPAAIEKMKEKPFTIKEGTTFRMRAKFKVQHEVLSGLKYVQAVKRKGIRVSKDEEMLGSYGPNTEATPYYEKRFHPDEAPSGMLARGHYDAVSQFIDDDKNIHLKFEWSFDIKKDWDAGVIPT